MLNFAARMRRHLPTLLEPLAQTSPPRVDVARRRLGGRGTSQPGTAELVELIEGSSAGQRGIVLFVSGDELDVWLAPGRVQRTIRAHVRPVADLDNPDFRLLASEVETFAQLREGTRVRYVDGALFKEGTLVEKCRYGGLVLRDDQHIVAVGFRKLYAASAPLPS